MAVNRDHWKGPFIAFPPWICPSCKAGSLFLDKKTLHCESTHASRAAQGTDEWEPDWIEERFVGLLRCQNQGCRDIVAIGGRTRFEENHDYDEGPQFIQAFEPQFIYPPPHVFQISKKCPSSVADEIRSAFGLLWSDTKSCANRLRSAAEILLTDRKVPTRRLNKNKKYVRIDLHARIEMFKKKDSNSAEYLLAIKWLGNIGSHTSLDNLEVDDLLNGFDLFEHVIQHIYEKHEQNLNKIAKSITARKGKPVKPNPWRLVKKKK